MARPTLSDPGVFDRLNSLSAAGKAKIEADRAHSRVEVNWGLIAVLVGNALLWLAIIAMFVSPKLP